MQELPSGQVGTYREKPLHLATRAADPPHTDFAVVLYYKRPSTGTVEIVKVDNSHGTTHIHQYYRRDQPKETVDWSVWEAMEVLTENCVDFAERYDNAHGL